MRSEWQLSTVAAPKRSVRLRPILLNNSALGCGRSFRERLGEPEVQGRREVGAAQVAITGGAGMSFASFRRFWAVAARRNSSWRRMVLAAGVGRGAECASDGQT